MNSKLRMDSLIIMFFVLAISTSKSSNEKISLNQYKAIRGHNYQYALKINTLEQPEYLGEEEKGTIIKGNFSTLTLKDKENKEFIYQSETLTIKSPALHEFDQVTSELIELEIKYRIKVLPEFNANLTYTTVTLSFLFMLSEYLPEKDILSMQEFINSIRNQQNFDLRTIIRQEITGPVLAYPINEDGFSTLKIIRKELRLIGKTEQTELLSFAKLPEKNLQEKIIKPSKIYELKSFSENQNDL